MRGHKGGPQLAQLSFSLFGSITPFKYEIHYRICILGNGEEGGEAGTWKLLEIFDEKVVIGQYSKESLSVRCSIPLIIASLGKLP